MSAANSHPVEGDDRPTTRYRDLSREQLEARLAVAEDTLVLIGWTSTTLGQVESERSKAAEEMWQTWCSMVGGSDFCAPERHRKLDRMIPRLAEARDRKRAATLRRFGLEEPEVGT